MRVDATPTSSVTALCDFRALVNSEAWEKSYGDERKDCDQYSNVCIHPNGTPSIEIDRDRRASKDRSSQVEDIIQRVRGRVRPSSRAQSIEKEED